jgi:PAS domain S-box-containing protein
MMAAAIRVLYVDDESALLELCKVYLERAEEFIVTTSSSAPEAIRKLELVRFDAIVSDYQMPEMDGIEFLKVVRGRGDKTPFIIFTGKGREEVVIEALNAGADFYLQKGGEPKAQFAELAHKIRRAVEHRIDQKALLESEGLFKQIFSGMPSGVAIYTAVDNGEDFVFRDFNTAAEAIEHIKRQDIIGRKVTEVFPGVKKFGILSVFQRVWGTGKPEFFPSTIYRDARDPGTWRENWVYRLQTGDIVAIYNDITERKRAEEALRDSEEKYRILTEKTNDIIYSIDLTGRITYVSPQISRYGYSPVEIISNNLTSYVIEEDLPRVLEDFKTTTSIGQPTITTFRIRDKFGTIHWMEDNGAAILDKSNNVIGISGILRDITERKQVEDALWESKENYKNLVDNIQDGIYTLDCQGNFQFVNSEIVHRSGYSAEWFIGRNYLEVISPEYHKTVQKFFEEAMVGRAPPIYEVAYPIASGKLLYVELKTSPIVKNDQVVGLLGISRDITERKKAEQALREAALRWQTTFDSTQDAICIVDADQRIVTCNRMMQEIVDSKNVDDLVGRHCWEVVHKTTGPIPGCPFVRMRDSRAREQMELKIDDRWFVVTVDPILDEAGKLIGAVHNIRDITDQKRVEEALQITNEKYSKAFLSVPDAITISELDSGRFIEVNDAATRIFGYSRDELIGKSAVELGIWLNKEDRERFIDQVRKHGKVSQFEVMERHKSGELYNALVNADTISIGNVSCLIAIIHDITERKQIEMALRESSRKLQEAQEMAHLGFWSWDIKTGRVEWSDEVFRIFGLDPKEFTPQINSILALSPWPEDQQRDKELIRRAIESREPGTYEQRFLRPDNSTGYYHSTFQGRYDDGNNLTSIVGTVLDITERKRVEEELQVTKEKYTKAFLSVPDAITISELESGRFIEVNDAASTLFGYTRDELVNKSGIDLGIWVNKEERDVLIDQIKKEGRVVQFRVAERRKSGELFNASITADTITIGNTRYLIAATRDITQRKQMEEALRESETRYKNIVEDQTEFISRFLPDGTHVFVNDAYCRYFGKTREEIIGHLFVPDIPEEDQKIVREHFQLLTPDNPVASVDHRIIMPDGSVRWQRWSDRAIFNNTGHIVEYQSVGRDITDTKQVERELKNSEHLRQDIIDHLPDPTFVINAHGTVIAWNKAMEELSGVPAWEMVGKGNYEYAIPFYGVRQPILIDLALQYDEEVWKKYDSIQRDGKTLVAETTNARPRGQPAVLWGKASPVYDENGRIIGAIETIRNITERKRMEDGLRESEERYSSIFDNNYSVSLLIDPDTGKIVEANAAAVRYYGYSHDEFTSRGIYDLNRLPQNKVVRDLQQAKHEKAKHFFSTHYLASGNKRNVEIYSGPITIQGKSYFYSIIHDITERKQAEEALALASKKLNLLSSITRHDILNQLTVLRGYIDLSEDMLNDPVKMREFLEKEEKAAATIEEQIAFTKEYQEMGVSAPSWQNVNASIEKAQKQFLMRDVRIDVDCTDLEVYTDPLFEKVFYNLIDNALRYGGDGMKAIRVQCQESNDGLVITCEDNGVGITQEDKKRLFTRGFGKHTGLGLFLTREILGITGITITENGIPGKGARFEITVPKGAWRFAGKGD